MNLSTKNIIKQCFFRFFSNYCG